MRVKNFALRHYVGRCHIKGQTGREAYIKGPYFPSYFTSSILTWLLISVEYKHVMKYRIRKLYSLSSPMTHIALLNMSWLCTYPCDGFSQRRLYLPYISVSNTETTQLMRGPSLSFRKRWEFLDPYSLFTSFSGGGSHLLLHEPKGCWAEKCFHSFSTVRQITPFAYYQNVNWTQETHVSSEIRLEGARNNYISQFFDPLSICKWKEKAIIK